jgi:hypothetical protein
MGRIENAEALMETCKDADEKLIRGVMMNYPEFSFCLSCSLWKYDEMKFHFVDVEEQALYLVELGDLLRGLKVLRGAIAAGKFAASNFDGSSEDGGSWDAVCVDALVQCAVFGEVLYG